MKTVLKCGASALILAMAGAMAPVTAQAADAALQVAQAETNIMTSDNPFFHKWTTRFGVPPYDAIKPEHFKPAYEKAMADQLAEIKAITDNKDAPTFANTIDALEMSGKMLGDVGRVFGSLTASNTNDRLQQIQREMAPVLAKHSSAINLDAALFARVDALYAKRDSLKLSAEQKRVLERYHLDFVRAGAKLEGKDRERMAAVMQRLAVLSTQFSQNVLADEKDYKLILTSKEELAGLPDFVVAAASQAAKDRGDDGKYVITLSRSSIEPFLTFSANRPLREQAWKAWIARGDNGDAQDNNAIIKEIVQLRIERANLLGYKTFAEYKLADTMAKTPQAVSDLLMQVWEPAKVRAAEEKDDLAKMAASEGQNITIEPWDWYYYAEKVRKAKYDLNEEEIKPYFQLDKMMEAVFYTANQLFGVTFHELKDAPRYHPDVKVYEVKDRKGNHVAVFYSDNFARPSKRSGAWMSSLREQQKLGGVVHPIVMNNNNFAKGAEGQPTLLSFDDATTLFHEFGHGLHGMLSDVTYPQLSGTSVLRDFVEFPSQILEHWIAQPEVLRRFAVHYKTGEPIPKALLDKILAAQTFNQGFATVSYTSSALVDLAYHSLTDAKNLDPDTFEREELAKLGMPKEIVMRHRSPHFTHVFSGDGYSAGYYSYMWAEVLDADGFDAFTEAGNIFDPKLAKKLYEQVYSAGGSKDPMDAYIAFRGRAPKVEALLRNRGLLGTGSRVN